MSFGAFTVLAASWTWSTNVTTIPFLNLGTYRELLIQGIGLQIDTGTPDVFLQVSTDNGSTYKTTNGDYARAGISAGTSSIVWTTVLPTATPASCLLQVYNFNIPMQSMTQVLGGRVNSNSGAQFAVGYTTAANAYNAFRIGNSTGANFTAGTINVYGKQ